jgi:hypothetical protein
MANRLLIDHCAVVMPFPSLQRATRAPYQDPFIYDLAACSGQSAVAGCRRQRALIHHFTKPCESCGGSGRVKACATLGRRRRTRTVRHPRSLSGVVRLLWRLWGGAARSQDHPRDTACCSYLRACCRPQMDTGKCGGRGLPGRPSLSTAVECGGAGSSAHGSTSTRADRCEDTVSCVTTHSGRRRIASGSHSAGGAASR